MNEYSRDLCDERHERISVMLEKIDKKTDTLFSRLNWFYLVAIGTMASAISAIVISCVKW
jgi:tartrate dehydratase beta subunit/fumarate hydratase class I family protein